MIGKNILHYKILEKLGEGGMGIVWKAEDTKLNRLVAIKVLPPHLLISADDKARFHREAKAAAALNHSNIATVYEINESEDKPFIVMEYVEGATLDNTIAKGPLPLQDAIDITIQIADGLAAAHKKDVVHRDVKASNILYSADKKAKILDFGLAKTSMSTKLTQMGTTIGTVAYMSPEQVQGKEVDHRTDLWSLGVLLYEMIAGHLPFKAEYDQAIFYSIQNENPDPLTAIRTGVPMSLEWIVNKLMAKDPEERYQSAKDLIIDLKAVDLKDSGFSRITKTQTVKKTISAPLSKTAMQNQIPWIISSASLILMLFFLIMWSPWTAKKTNDENPVNFVIQAPKDNVINVNTYGSVVISPDGTAVIFRSNDQLYLRRIDKLEAVLLQGTLHAISPFFSTDGKWVGFFSDGKLKKISVNGGVPIVLADAGDNRGATWGEKGDIVYAGTTTAGLYHINETGGAVKELTTLNKEKNERTHRWPCFLPGGDIVLYTMGIQDSPDYYEDSEIQAYNLRTGEVKVILKGASTAKYITEGYLIYSRKGVLYGIGFDADKLQTSGTAVILIDELNGDATSGAMHYSFSDNGTLIYIPGNSEGEKRNVVRIDMQGNRELIDIPAQLYLEPRISTDGKKVAVAIGAGKDFDVWTFSINGGNLSRLTFGGVNRSPIWSFDDKRIAFSTQKNNVRTISVTNSDGSGNTKILTNKLARRAYIGGWSKGGNKFLLDTYHATDQSNLLIFDTAKPDTSEPFLTTPADEWLADLSPDSKWLAYVSNETGPYDVYIQPFNKKGGKWQVSINGGIEPRWADNGKKLFYIKGANMVMVPVVVTENSIKLGKEVILFPYSALAVDSGITYDITPDGKYCITTQTKSGQSGSYQVNVIVNWKNQIKKLFGSLKTAG